MAAPQYDRSTVSAAARVLRAVVPEPEVLRFAAVRVVDASGRVTRVRLRLNKTGSAEERGEHMNTKRFVLAHAWFVAPAVIAMIAGLEPAPVYKPAEA